MRLVNLFAENFAKNLATEAAPNANPKKEKLPFSEKKKYKRNQ